MTDELDLAIPQVNELLKPYGLMVVKEGAIATARVDALEAAAKEAEARGAVGAADAIRALIDKEQPSTFKVKSFGAKQLECTTEGCTETPIDHIIMGGIGSDYCIDCADKIIAKYKGERS